MWGKTGWATGVGHVMVGMVGCVGSARRDHQIGHLDKHVQYI